MYLEHNRSRSCFEACAAWAIPSGPATLNPKVQACKHSNPRAEDINHENPLGFFLQMATLGTQIKSGSPKGLRNVLVPVVFPGSQHCTGTELAGPWQGWVGCFSDSSLRFLVGSFGSWAQRFKARGDMLGVAGHCEAFILQSAFSGFKAQALQSVSTCNIAGPIFGGCTDTSADFNQLLSFVAPFFRLMGISNAWDLLKMLDP